MMSDTGPIRVIMVDDHAMVRSGLRFFVKSFDDLDLVGEASSGTEAIDLCLRVQPDVVLMDMVMPGMDGAEATAAIRQQWPKIQVIALTSFQEDNLIERALQAGAIGYLLKNVSAQELAQAIRAAYVGRSTLAQEAADVLIAATRQKADIGSDLTERESEVLALLGDGLTNAQIAERLVVSQATVKFHVRNILSKLGAANRNEATALAWQYRLLKKPGPLRRIDRE
jgi:two-component system, NarL family, response regulator LiaR